MWKLILILTFTSNGASVEVEEMEFDTEKACKEARIEILNDFEKDPVGSDWNDARILSRLHIDAYCVASGRRNLVR